MIKKASLIFLIIGIIVLIFISFKSPIKNVNFENLEGMEINTRVEINGKVEGVKDFEDFKILIVDGIEIICDCKQNYLGKQIKIIGLVDEYNGKRQIKALKISLD